MSIGGGIAVCNGRKCIPSSDTPYGVTGGAWSVRACIIRSGVGCCLARNIIIMPS